MSKKMGRPLIEINQEQFENLCSLHCTLIEIAEWFKCSEDTIERWSVRTYEATFADTFKKKSSKGKISLRRKMYETAMTGNVTMQIWLSKQQLGMTDKVEQTSHEIKYDARTIEEFEKLTEQQIAEKYQQRIKV